ncbi:MAG: hypothetical protein Phog2KO_38890 [Phototrophicaceae bacterium]
MRYPISIILILLILSACEPSAQLVIPTDVPTATVTFTPTVARDSDNNPIPTLTPFTVVRDENAPTPTSLFGSTRTPVPDDFPTATRPFDPNAPRIDFFTSDPIFVAPGATLTLFWSTRNVDSAVIYRVDSTGARSQVYNVVPDGNLEINTSSAERGTLRYALAIGEGADYVEEILVVPLECPDEWFFIPAPAQCAEDEAISTRIIDMQLERGRMLYIEETDTIYALFNDGLATAPGWLSYGNRYDPEIHPARDENAPPEFIQPLNELGFVWRGDADVRNRLGLGLSDAIEFEGFIQTSGTGNNETTYISGSTGIVLQIEAGEDVWQIIGDAQ